MPLRRESSAGVNAGAVQGTNDCSILSKLSAACSGYFADDYVRFFASRKLARRSPIINRGYYIRFKAITDTLLLYLRSCVGPLQIVSLGAGFDTTFFRMKPFFENSTFFEVDFPEVVKRKAKLIVGSEELCSRLGSFDVNGYDGLSSRNYRLIGADLRDLSLLEAALKDGNINTTVPTLLLSECVLTYMEPDKSSQLIHWASRTFPDCVFLTYEQIYPDDAFGTVMRRHFDKLRSPLRSIAFFPDCERQKSRYCDAGFTGVTSSTMLEYFRSLDDSEKLRIRLLEPFDEYEEWYLKCGHYLLIAAVRGNLKLPLPILTTSGVGRVPHQVLASSAVTTLSVAWSAYGHATAAPSGTSFVLAVGGFGDFRGCHMKLADISAIDVTTGITVPVCSNKSVLTDGIMYHSVTALRSGSLLVFGGRRSPEHPCFISLTMKLHSVQNNCIHMDVSTCTAMGDVPSSRWRHTVTPLVSDSGNDCLVLFGGRNTTTVLGDCFVMVGDIWHRVETVAITARHSHASCAVTGTMMATYGGLDCDENSLADLWSFDTRDCQWTRLMAQQPLCAKFSHTMHTLPDSRMLIIIGGVDESGSGGNRMTTFDTVSGEVREWSLPNDMNSNVFMWHNHQSELIGDHIYVLGGGGNCFSFGTHLNRSMAILSIPKIKEALLLP